MPGSGNDKDLADRKLSIGLFTAIAAVLIFGGAVLFLIAGPALYEMTAGGIDLRMAAVIAFFVTIAVIVVMAVVAGDGLLGEIQYMLLGFAGFFVVFWFMIAWIF